MDIEKYIKVVNDFPKKGVIFKDISPIFLNPRALEKLIDELAEAVRGYGATKMFAAEARGFMFATLLAIKLGMPFVPVRKKGKLPRETFEVSYSLEYGTDTLCVHKDDVSPSDKILVFDDILATGGTAKAMCDLAEGLGAEVAGLAFIMELSFLKGREFIGGKKIHSMIVE